MGGAKRTHPCRVAAATRGIIAAIVLLCLTAATGRASEGNLIEVIQPMGYGGSDAIVLHAVTYITDSEGGGPGEEIDFVGRMNALTNGREAINTNVASTCGVIVRVTNRGRI